MITLDTAFSLPGMALELKITVSPGLICTFSILVDGLGVGDVGNIVLRDRQHLAEDGIMIVVMMAVIKGHASQPDNP